MMTARATVIIPIVRYCRCKNASAPSLMASAISCISGVPLCCRKTYLAKYPATTKAKRLTNRLNTIRRLLFRLIGTQALSDHGALWAAVYHSRSHEHAFRLPQSHTLPSERHQDMTHQSAAW